MSNALFVAFFQTWAMMVVSLQAVKPRESLI